MRAARWLTEQPVRFSWTSWECSLLSCDSSRPALTQLALQRERGSSLHDEPRDPPKLSNTSCQAAALFGAPELQGRKRRGGFVLLVAIARCLRVLVGVEAKL